MLWTLVLLIESKHVSDKCKHSTLMAFQVLVHYLSFIVIEMRLNFMEFYFFYYQAVTFEHLKNHTKHVLDHYLFPWIFRPWRENPGRWDSHSGHKPQFTVNIYGAALSFTSALKLSSSINNGVPVFWTISRPNSFSTPPFIIKSIITQLNSNFS